MPRRHRVKEEYTTDVPAHTEWFTLEQSAAYLQINLATLYKIRKNGLIVEKKLGTHIRIHRDELERILKEGLPSVWSTKSDTSGQP